MTTTLAYILGVLVLIVGIIVSIALHELGHMIPAKRFGVKVPEYFIGFGPRLWSTRRGETEYGVKAIWLGGYVKLLGMLPPARPDRPDKPGSMIAEARQEDLAELGDDQDRAFYRLSVPRKLLVMAGGILTNLVLGIICLVVALGVIGQYTYTSTLSRVEACVSETGPGASEPPESEASGCAGKDPSPAAAADLRAGDEIVSWNGTPTPVWADVQAAIRAGGTAPADVVVRRDGTEMTLRVVPVEAETPVTSVDGTTSTQRRPFVGIRPTTDVVPVPASRLPGEVGTAVQMTLKAIVTLPMGLYHSVAAGLGMEERSPEGLVSLVGVGRMAGEVSSAGVGSGALPLSARLSTMLGLLGSLNLALFAFNLIPLLPLDGGHVAGACWEGLRRTVARWWGRPDPGYVDTARMLPVGQVVVVLLVVMAAVLVWVDVVAPI